LLRNDNQTQKHWHKYNIRGNPVILRQSTMHFWNFNWIWGFSLCEHLRGTRPPSFYSLAPLSLIKPLSSSPVTTTSLRATIVVDLQSISNLENDAFRSRLLHLQPLFSSTAIAYSEFDIQRCHDRESYGARAQ